MDSSRTGPDSGRTEQDDGQDSLERVTLAEAARRLGATPETLRKRIQRGTLAGEKVDGVWTVRLPRQDRQQDSGQDTSGQPAGQASGQPDPAVETLIATLRDEVAFLRSRVEAHEEAERQLRVILAQQTEMLRALPATSEAPDTRPDEGPPTRPDDSSPTRPDEYPGAYPAPRPWWRFWGRGKGQQDRA